MKASLQAFVDASRRALASQPPETALPAMAEALKPMLRDPDLLSGELALPRMDRWESYLLYEDPDYRFVVTALIHPAGHAGSVHDHGVVWTIYGLYRGDEEIARYRRTDDGVSGALQLEEAGRTRVAQGYVDVVFPGEIHVERNLRPEPSLAIVVRSQNLGDTPQNIFHADSGRVESIFGKRALPLPSAGA